MNFKIESMNKGALITSIIFLVIGLLLMVWPEIFARLFPVIIGICFIGLGIYLLVCERVFKKTINVNLFGTGPSTGIMSIIFGVITICSTNLLFTLFRNIIGIWLIIKGCIRLKAASMFKGMDAKYYISGLVMGIGMSLVGLYVLTTPHLIVKTIGIIVFVYSLVELISNIVIERKVKYYESNKIPKENVKEIEYTEINVEK